MSELLNETIIGLSSVASMLPGKRGATRLSPATVFRWCTVGTKTTDGRRVRLESFRAGNRILTTREAVIRYFDSLNPITPIEPQLAPRSPAATRRAAAQAEQELILAGC